MKTSGVFTIHQFTAPNVKANQPFRLVFFGDVHWDSPNHARAKWLEFLAYAKKLPNDTIFIGMGDYLDSTSTSERECLGNMSTKMHETLRNDIIALQMAKVEAFAKELAFMKGRLVGLLNGNHYFQFPSGINTDQKLCELLGVKYLGVSTFTRITATRGTADASIDIFAHHGAGGARLPGGSINRVAQLTEYADADILAMGHDHKRGIFPANPTIGLRATNQGLKLKERSRWLARTGSFLAAYEDGVSNYNVDAARGPCSLGWVEFDLCLRRTHTSKSDSLQLVVERGIA